MKLNCVIVSVDYAPMLRRSIDRWKRNVDQLFVVTSSRDLDTLGLCHEHDVPAHATDAFYRRGAMFNKGAALSELIETMDLLTDCDAFLFADADVIPPNDYRIRLEMAEPKSGHLYGCPRHAENGALIPDGELAGYHHLFFVNDPAVQRKPLLDCSWKHVAGYDTVFIQRWPKDRHIILPIPLIHLGDVGRNWCGVNRKEEMAALLASRRRGNGYQSERLPP